VPKLFCKDIICMLWIKWFYKKINRRERCFFYEAWNIYIFLNIGCHISKLKYDVYTVIGVLCHIGFQRYKCPYYNFNMMTMIIRFLMRTLCIFLSYLLFSRLNLFYFLITYSDWLVVIFASWSPITLLPVLDFSPYFKVP